MSYYYLCTESKNRPPRHIDPGKIPTSEEEVEKIIAEAEAEYDAKYKPKAPRKSVSKRKAKSSSSSDTKRKSEPSRNKSGTKRKSESSHNSAAPQKRARKPPKNKKATLSPVKRIPVDKPSSKPTRIQPKRGQKNTEKPVHTENINSNQSVANHMAAPVNVIDKKTKSLYARKPPSNPVEKPSSKQTRDQPKRGQKNTENITSNQSDANNVTAPVNVLDKKFKSLYLKEFGGEMAAGEVNVNWTWKELYDNAINLKKSFTSGITPTIMDTSVGVLRWEKEEAALFEDNPQIAPVDREISKGYTGLQALNSLPKPPNSGNGWEIPLLLYGDFDGIKLYDSTADFLCGKRRAYISMGEEHGQVTTVVVCKFIEDSESAENAPCCFIGYESGCVAALTATLCDEGSSYNFFVERHRHVHNSRVSALTIMDCKSSSNSSHPDTVLLSACYDGQVFYYPNSLNPDSSFDLTHTLAFSNAHPDTCPILTMTSTTFVENNKAFNLVCTGDREGSVRLWLAMDGFLDSNSSSEALFNQVKWYKSKGKHCVTMAKFVNSHMLCSGNNQGDVRIWNLVTMDGTDDGNNTFPGLSLCHFFKHAHNGPVETAMHLGDVIITSGGNDGNLFGWDMTSGKQLGVLSCHYGQETFDETTGEKGLVKSCVVGAQIVNNGLISLCRDGVLAELKCC